MSRSLPALTIALGVVAAARGTSAHPLDDLQPGEWYEAPSSHMSAVDPCPAQDCSYSAVEGQSAVIADWSGGAFDATHDRLLVWGGGHGGYAGNEIYGFDIETLTWSRLTEPSDPPGQDVPYAPDGGPTSRHTYDYVQYAPAIDSLCTLGGAGFYVTGQTGTDHTDCYDFVAKAWKAKADVPGSDNRIGAISAYDPASKLLFYHSTFTGRLASFDAAMGTWKDHGVDSIYLEYYTTAAIDPVRHKLVAAGDNSGDPSSAGKLLVWDIGDPSAATIGCTPVSTTGDQAVLSAGSPGFDYDPVSDRLVAWIGGSDVYTLDMDALTWEKRPATNAVVPTPPDMNGTFGRFRYVPSRNVFIVVNGVDDDVYFYKLAAGGGTGGTGGTGAGGANQGGGGAADTTGAGAGGGSSAGAGPGGGQGDTDGDGDGGCACGTAGGASRWDGATSVLLVALAIAVRARRRSSRCTATGTSRWPRVLYSST